MHTTAARFTVFLIDKDHGALDALSSLLRSAGYTTKAYTTPKAFLNEHDPSIYGSVVLDLATPLDEFEIREEFARQGVHRPIIFLAAEARSAYHAETLKGDAIKFLVKPYKEAELLDAMKAAMRQDSDRLHNFAVARRVDTLSLRERQVLALVLRGVSKKAIAGALGLRETSVAVNCERAMKKWAQKTSLTSRG